MKGNDFESYDNFKYNESLFFLAKIPSVKYTPEIEKLLANALPYAIKTRNKEFWLIFPLIIFAVSIIFLRPNPQSPISNKGRNRGMEMLKDTMEKSYSVKLAKNVEQRLSDVKGIDEIKGEIKNVLDMLRHPAKFIEAGAVLPRGMLLVGPPGTGKTMLARAISGETGLNFIHCAGSEFDELFVGVGAVRIRKLFEVARQNQPCIIFIDEIDTLLSRSRRRGNEHSSSRATISEFLSQMDGFRRLENVVVIGATNFLEGIDSAALRPGRFDMKIFVPLPDLKGRKEIIEYYLSQIVHDFEIEVDTLARMTPGHSGAELKNLVNIAICHAIRKKKAYATMEDFEYARDRIMMGIERPSMRQSDQDKLYTAFHEAGHTLVSYYIDDPKYLYKVTILPRGSSLGSTHHISKESEVMLHSKEDLMKHIYIYLGGHIAEKRFIGKNKITTGCSNDLEEATKIAYYMVRHFGMGNEELGLASARKDFLSDKTNSLIDQEVRQILSEASVEVEKIIESHEKQMRDLAQELFSKETLQQEDIVRVIRQSSQYLIMKCISIRN